MAELLERAEGGRRALGLLAGDAGVGKTRLLAELARVAEERGTRVLVGGCMETGDLGLPYVPFVDALRGLGDRPAEAEVVGSLVAAVPNLGRLLPALAEERGLAPIPNDEFEQVELFGGIHSLLVRLSEIAPVLLVIEDLHWADRSTRDLFAFLVRTLRSGRIAIVASYRSDDLHRRHPLRPFLSETARIPDVERVDLSPFSREELAQHLGAIVGTQLEPAMVDRILARSEGNAFFAEELVAAGATRSEVVLPEALADLLRNRIETLSQPAKESLKVFSVAGRKVSHQLLVEACGCSEEELESGLREAIAAQVIVADPATETYRFRHALIQEAVYGDLLPGERSRLHATYARLLEESGPAAELAHHRLASHDLPNALGALLRAAAEAMSVSAPAETYSHLTQALEIWDLVPDPGSVTGSDHASLLMKTALAAGNAGEFKHAVALAAQAVEEIDAVKDPARAALANEQLGEHQLQVRTSDEDTLETFRRAVQLVPPEPPTALRARVTGGLARALSGVRCYTEAAKWAQEALEVARSVDAGEEETHALITLAVIDERHDKPDLARSLLLKARARAAEVGARTQELRAQYSIGGLELDIADLDAAQIALEETVALAERSGLQWSQFGIGAGILRSFAYYAAGRWDDAERLAMALDESMSGSEGISAAALYVEVGRGDPGANGRLAQLESRWKDDDWVAYIAGGCGVDLALWEGDLDRARALTQRTLSMMDLDETWELSAIWPATLGIAAEAEAAERARLAGDETALAEALRTGKELLERCREAERKTRSVGRQIGQEAVAWLARAEAEYARLEGSPAIDLWTTTVKAFGYGYVYEEARSRWRLAEALLAEGRREEAAEEAHAAYAIATDLSARPLIERLEALARRGRVDLGTELGPGEGAAGLTARELEVLRLVAAGRSNQQIADELFISRKTASVHVSHILAKLEVSSRGEAAATAHRLGLDGSPGEAP